MIEVGAKARQVAAPDLGGGRTAGALSARIVWSYKFPFLPTDTASLGASLCDLVALELAIRPSSSSLATTAERPSSAA
jgi:hypothetical protein